MRLFTPKSIANMDVKQHIFIIPFSLHLGFFFF